MIALASILYGSVMAFTQTDVRLIAGYSSIAQLGFITAGIFALRPDGADGALLQMVNHGLVVAPLFLIIAVLAERTGSEDLREMGGEALRAPVLAALFLIVALATLAMPGSANFIGEFYILNALLPGEDRLRVRRRRRGRAGRLLRAAPLPAHDARPQAGAGSSRARSACATGSCVVPLVACIVALAFYPQLILKRTDESATRRGRRGQRREPAALRERWPAMTFNAPDIDYAALSPIIALTAGICVVLMAGVFEPPEERGAAPHPDHPRHRGRTLHLAVGRAQGPRRRRAADRRAGGRGGADRDPRRRGHGAALDPRAGGRAGRRGRVPHAAARLGAGDGAAGRRRRT